MLGNGSLKSPANQLAVFFLLLGINFILCSLFIGLTAIMFFGAEFFTEDYPSSAEVLRYVSSVTEIGVFGLTAFVFAFLVNDKKPMPYLQLRCGVPVLSYLFLVLIIVASIPALSYVIEWNESIKLPQFMSSIEAWMREQEDSLNGISSLMMSGNTVGILLINLLVIAIIPAVCEEFLFRGVILTWFRNIFRNVHVAVFLSAFIFSAIHFQFYGFVPRFLMGLFFGYLFVWTGSIIPCIIAHFINNGTAVIASYLYNKQLIDTEYSDFGNVGDNYFLIAISVIFTSVFIYLLYRKRKIADIS